MKKIYGLDEIVKIVRKKSPFYRNLYKNLGEVPLISDLPIVDQSLFWIENNYKNNNVCTDKICGGVIFRSGGTTGVPKFSWYNKIEWETFTTVFGEGISKLDLSPNDRVGNLFYAGEMYASFLFINKSLENSPINLLQFPLAGHISLDSALNSINDYDINVLMGVPTTFVQMAISLEKKLDPKLFLIAQKIEKIFYGGESLFLEQEELLKRVFKNLKTISSVGYASVDAGHLGYCSKDFEKGIHGVFSDSSIVEIVDQDSGEIIDRPDIVGKLIYTNLSRLGMPIIRYPTGDKGKWCLSGVGERFHLLGRSEEGARVGPVTVTREDILEAFKSSGLFHLIDLFQLQIDRIHGFDQLTLMFSSRKILDLREIEILKEHFYLQRKMFKDCVSQGVLAPLQVIQLGTDEFSRNPRTGKLIFIADKRFN